MLFRSVERYQGRIIKTIGDEIMCVFPCADQGLLSASAMHAAVAAASPGGSKVSIHVGLHFGPVVSEDGDVFGDTVNAAAYLTAVAGADQILLTEATEVALSPELKICVRPVFMAVLKGASGESTIFQVLWKKDNPSITDVNLGVHKIIPGDLGSLLVTYGERQYRVDQHTSSVLMGRGEDCDVVVADRLVQIMDRSDRNPNILWAVDGTPWAIDYGACLMVERVIAGSRFTFDISANHFLRPRRSASAMIQRVALPTESDLAAWLAEVPDSWLTDAGRDRDSLRRGLTQYLAAFERTFAK